MKQLCTNLPLTTTTRNFSSELLCCVHTVLVVERFDSLFPCIKVECVDIFDWRCWIDHHIEWLSLIDVLLSVSSLIDDDELIDLCKCSEDCFFCVRKEIKMLYWSVVVSNWIPCFFGIVSFFFQELLEIFVFDWYFCFCKIFDIVVWKPWFNTLWDLPNNKRWRSCWCNC